MKVIIAILALLISSTSFSMDAAFDTVSKTEMTQDGGKKRARKNRRINKKRKKKCKQFGRKVYAG